MKIIWFTLLFMLFTSQIFAENIRIVGSMEQTIPISNAHRSVLKAQAAARKNITVLKLQLSDNALNAVRKKAAHLHRTHSLDDNVSFSPKRVQLGMAGIPVLDQGRHGTCVTFAVTAAIDAVLRKGDYISQLCQLQLGIYLEKNAYAYSGWDGSWGRDVLTQMNLFGIVTKEQQITNGCGGLTSYPDNENTPNTEMTPYEFHQISEKLNEHLIGWSNILDAQQAMTGHIDMNKVLRNVKATLMAGDRLIFGMLIPDARLGIAGAVGKYHVTDDTWVLTPEIEGIIQSGQSDYSGHEMIITGFDDNAIAIDNEGRISKGLLTLRNSWGSVVGDQGDFYVTYDYFKVLVEDIQRIRHL